MSDQILLYTHRIQIVNFLLSLCLKHHFKEKVLRLATKVFVQNKSTIMTPPFPPAHRQEYLSILYYFPRRGLFLFGKVEISFFKCFIDIFMLATFWCFQQFKFSYCHTFCELEKFCENELQMFIVLSIRPNFDYVLGEYQVFKKKFFICILNIIKK